MCIGSEAARNDPLVVWSQRDPFEPSPSSRFEAIPNAQAGKV